MLELDFMRHAFGAGIVVGLLAPAVGFFLVQRRLSLIGDGVGHVAFAGVALGYLLDLPLVLTALAVSVLGALSIEALRARRRTAGDQALALVFYTGIAGGVVLVSAAGALNVNLFQFLFGSILTVTSTDLATIAVSMRIVGVLLIAALMVLPVIAAGRLAWSVRSTVVLSMAIGLFAAIVGLVVSYYADLAPGGAIVLVAAAVTVLALLARPARG